MYPSTKEEILKEVKNQLARFLLSDRHTLDWLENESRTESEYPIVELAVKAGYANIGDMLHSEFKGFVRFVGNTIIEAGPKLYDTPELQHIISLQKRTVTKEKTKIRAKNDGRKMRMESRPQSHHTHESAASTIHRVRESSTRQIRRRRRYVKFSLDSRGTEVSDLMDCLAMLKSRYGSSKPHGVIANLFVACNTVPGIAYWRLLMKNACKVTAKFAKITVINDVTPNMLFFEELSSGIGLRNYGETYLDTSSRKLYSIWTGKLRTRNFRVMFLL